VNDEVGGETVALALLALKDDDVGRIDGTADGFATQPSPGCISSAMLSVSMRLPCLEFNSEIAIEAVGSIMTTTCPLWFFSSRLRPQSVVCIFSARIYISILNFNFIF
jgi:hypothetical protein